MLLHLELRTRQIREDGTNAADAERIAQRDFGNLSLLRETSREVWTWRWMESISQDLCFGVRQLAKQVDFHAAPAIERNRQLCIQAKPPCGLG